jgi:acyl-CoA synthetase (AMP-forming)/AMP-acid ligase II
VAAIGLPDKRLGEIICAVIDPKPGEMLTEDEVNAFVQQALPRYKRPHKIIFDKIPRNATGKIEKAKLRLKYGGNVV